MKQAPLLECLLFDPFSLLDDGCGPAGVGIGSSDVFEALVVAVVVVVFDEGFDLTL